MELLTMRCQVIVWQRAGGFLGPNRNSGATARLCHFACSPAGARRCTAALALWRGRSSAPCCRTVGRLLRGHCLLVHQARAAARSSTLRPQACPCDRALPAFHQGSSAQHPLNRSSAFECTTSRRLRGREAAAPQGMAPAARSGVDVACASDTAWPPQWVAMPPDHGRSSCAPACDQVSRAYQTRGMGVSGCSPLTQPEQLERPIAADCAVLRVTLAGRLARRPTYRQLAVVTF